MLKYLEELCNLNGVSSTENDVREFIREFAQKHADKISEDAMGNLIVYKKREKKGPKLMISAHMDEVGFIVKSITDDGYLKILPVGGIDPRVVLGRKVYVGQYQIPGVLGLKAIHLTSLEERKEVPKWKDLYVDIGAKDKEAAERFVSLGDTIAFDSDFLTFGKGFLKAKAIDDRVGCAIMMNLMEKDLPMDVTFVFTVQEEIGARGAFGSAFAVKPDISLVLEGTTAADFSGVAPNKKVTCLGKGPVLGFMDSGTIYDRKLFEMTRDLADENKIPWQIKGRIAGGTDSQAVQRSRAGVRAANISVPVRNIHSANTVAKLSDIENAAKLAELFVEAVSLGKYK